MRLFDACCSLLAPGPGLSPPLSPWVSLSQTRARLVADPSLDAHVIEIEVVGPSGPDGSAFKVATTRFNPAAPGGVQRAVAMRNTAPLIDPRGLGFGCASASASAHTSTHMLSLHARGLQMR